MATTEKPLSAKDAAAKLKVELIENGIGTQAVHETVVAYRANRRAGTHKVKTKGEVSGSNKKPWRQKGTGNARAGYKQSPLWRGGGVVHGPVPRDYSKKTGKKVKKLALRKAISARVLAGDVFVVNAPKLEAPKTKTLFNQLNFNEDCRALLVLDGIDTNVLLSSRNSQLLDTVTASDLNAEHLLKYDRILATDAALETLAQRLN